MSDVWEGQPQNYHLPFSNKGKSSHTTRNWSIRPTDRNQTNWHQTGKQVSNPPYPVLMKGCPIGNCASSSLCLNATSLSPDSFLISLTSTFSLGPLQALLDSGSSHSFVDEMFAHHNKLPLAYLSEPIPLQLFNGSSTSSVTSKTQILITMPMRKPTISNFLLQN